MAAMTSAVAMPVSATAFSPRRAASSAARVVRRGVIASAVPRGKRAPHHKNEKPKQPRLAHSTF
jgi:hypothetical protein